MTEVVLNEGLSQISLLSIYVAMALYSAAFLLYTSSLAKLVSANDKSAAEKPSKLEKAALVITILAALVHGVAVVLRGIAAARVPWANMYEFTITGTFFATVIFLIAMSIREVRFIATFITGFVLLTLGIATSVFYVEVKSLMPALQSYWIVIHVLVAVLATAFFTIASALSTTYLFQTAGWVQTTQTKGAIAFRKLLAAFPKPERLDRLAYRFNIVGFILWTFTLIAGAIWAERAWHRYWGWDTKEVWTFIIWTIYAGYLHANATRGWTGKRSAWLSLIGFAAVIFNFTIVNLFFKGLHVYSGL